MTADAGIKRPVMGGPRLNADQITTWFAAKEAKFGKHPCFTHGKTVHDMAKLFVREGKTEGVRGDIAFAQGVLESDYYTFSGRVPCSANNYSGLGATDGTSDYGVFPFPRIGVRAQIQHLRRYGDATAKVSTLHKPLVDTRFRLVKPPGKAPSWDNMGNGNWATSPIYGGCVMKIYNNMLKVNGLSKEGRLPC
jgi:hypothetical protein